MYFCIRLMQSNSFKIIYILILVLLILSTKTLSAGNPFLPMVGKPYTEYYTEYKKIVDQEIYRDSLSRVNLLNLLKEAATKDITGEWEFNYRNIENHIKFFESRQGGFVALSDYSADDFIDCFLNCAEEARERGFNFLELHFIYDAADGYRIFKQNYERAFHYYLLLAEKLNEPPFQKFPLRGKIFNTIADLYYTFREYDDAIHYYSEAMRGVNSDVCYSLNGFGLSYRKKEDYEKSNLYFNLILDSARLIEDSRIFDNWEGIAIGNIGINHYLTGDLEGALPVLITATEKIRRIDDYPFLSSCAVWIANIYIQKRDKKAAEKYINLALEKHEATGIQEMSSAMYQLLFNYYLFIGDRQKTALYQDSTLIAKNRENELFSGLVLRHIEQRLRANDKIIYDKELETEKMRGKFFKRLAIVAIVALILILTLLWIVFVLYYHKRNAYRELVRKNQNWAGMSFGENFSQNIESEKNINKLERKKESDRSETVYDILDISDLSITDIKEEDVLVLRQVEKSILEKKLFRDTDLSLDLLASKTGFNKYYLSVVLNRCTQKNFNTYINEFRVKESIRMFSDPNHINMKIEQIAFESGFKDRKNFHRVFKRMTGLSPSEFRKSVALQNRSNPLPD